MAGPPENLNRGLHTHTQGGKRRANSSIPNRDREERGVKRAKVFEEEEDILTAATGQFNMSAMNASYDNTVRTHQLKLTMFLNC